MKIGDNIFLLPHTESKNLKIWNYLSSNGGNLKEIISNHDKLLNILALRIYECCKQIHSRASEFTPIYIGIRVTQSSGLFVMFCGSLFHCLSFCCHILHWLSVDLRLLIAHLVSLNFSKTKCVFSVDNNFTHQHIQPFCFFFINC